jgi:hypothetical protein
VRAPQTQTRSTSTGRLCSTSSHSRNHQEAQRPTSRSGTLLLEETSRCARMGPPPPPPPPFLLVEQDKTSINTSSINSRNCLVLGAWCLVLGAWCLCLYHRHRILVLMQLCSSMRSNSFFGAHSNMMSAHTHTDPYSRLHAHWTRCSLTQWRCLPFHLRQRFHQSLPRPRPLPREQRSRHNLRATLRFFVTSWRRSSLGLPRVWSKPSRLSRRLLCPTHCTHTT